MRAVLAALALAVATTGCHGRSVRVESGSPVVAKVSVTVTNSLSQSVMVYGVWNGQEHPLKEVPANSTLDVPIADVKAGDVIQLKATTSDGTRTYTKDGVSLQTKNTWKVP